MNIVILSNQSFFQELKTNKWHTATHLSRLGHRVVFIDPPLRFKAIKNLFSGKHSDDSLGVIVLRPLRPSLLKDFTKPFPILDHLFVKYTAWKIKQLLGNDIVLWVYHIGYPDLVELIKQIKPIKLIYDLVDEYTEFPEYKNIKSWIIERENWLLKEADICFTSAPALYKKAFKINKNSYYTPNAGDFELFSKAVLGVPSDIKDIPHPRVGFAGALDDFKVDIGLIKKCAEELPKVSFVLIGPQRVSQGANFNSSALTKYSNIHLLGQKKFMELPQYYQNFGAYYIPYVLNDYTMGGCFPVKFFEALSCGLPLTVTNLPAYHEFKDFCYIAKSDNDFVRLVKKSLEEDSKDRRSDRQKIAKANSYDNKVKKQLELLRHL
ncbi:hypothetical protein COT49_02485 [candidate division WWE3 bacterium CG08_land_8_20_14_0_20_40_13]|uniref:Glycosyl transferase family 1 n=1 Tax=candidate division WWE3 bacterium CG08_land_8_20_14_0_20_40_13 TaxID=1975084 RepID=A0A2H0XDD9_UNCKA|nr:MAG: hypothetical protein COT49_02485 [candidate division WWE3 bacterium CG08_land_8_20_14_0_20_40_13]